LVFVHDETSHCSDKVRIKVADDASLYIFSCINH
jgi:hypothetical protein